MKKLLSTLLAISIFLTTSAVGVSAMLEKSGEYTPDDSFETSRYYFYMPQEWCNEYSDTAGVYWWDVTDACSDANLIWPGYKAKESEEKNIYYIDCPSDVNIIVWNNYINGGIDNRAEIYEKAKQAKDSSVEFYSDGDTEVYTTEFFKYVEESFYGDKKALGKYADNFFIDKVYDCGMSFTMDKMIYVLDCDIQSRCMSDWYDNCYGVWYFYYGNREYGTYPLKEDAEKYGMVGTLPSYDPIYTPEETIPFAGDIPATEPTTQPTTEPTSEPVVEPPIPVGESFIYFDVKSTGWGNVKDVYCHVFRPDGTVTPTQWQSDRELCDYDESTGIASYDLSKLNFPITTDDGKEFCVIFSANTGVQTEQTVMNGNCIGDTMYYNGVRVINTYDYGKYFCYEAEWRKNPDLGSYRRFYGLRSFTGDVHLEGATDVTMLVDHLLENYSILDKFDVKYLIKIFEITPQEVMDIVVERADGNNADEKIQVIKEIIDQIIEDLKPFECDVNGDGVISIMDATMIQKCVVGLVRFTEEQLDIADVNKDGSVNISDVTELQRYLVYGPYYI